MITKPKKKKKKVKRKENNLIEKEELIEKNENELSNISDDIPKKKENFFPKEIFNDNKFIKFKII